MSKIHAKNVSKRFYKPKICKKNAKKGKKKGWSGPGLEPTAAWEVLPFATYGLLTP